ncbi:superoxide dismutase family protein [Pseudonocardia humida]|uniref:Superoxide dismutase family protein n=1 Tax=Pseudonocardia humida TaxID=2800819 RepID=A0ABT1A869_9PSEU|nr:superoxide dismutase family protein [Pseudonocardia humida]MCO1659220.1 superoxide dismutase family protein [Pseudonocardia humida]
MRALRVIIAGPVAALLLAGCAGGEPVASGAEASARDVAVNAIFTTTPEVAITYSEDLVRVGARGAVSAHVENDSTTVRLAVRGLLPDRVYGAHAHARPCGPDGDAAGPHFQHQPDPVQPSTDPRFANPDNEVWLDLATDARGEASVQTVVPWQFGERRARSVVIHAEPTRTGPGEAGVAGPRVACVTVDF